MIVSASVFPTIISDMCGRARALGDRGWDFLANVGGAEMVGGNNGIGFAIQAAGQVGALRPDGIGHYCDWNLKFNGGALVLKAAGESLCRLADYPIG